MAAPYGPAETTESTCAPKAARGRHLFNVAGYSLLKGLGAGNFIRSATFAVGGHDWCVRFYPDGDGREDNVTEGWISVHVERRSKSTEVRAFYGLRLTKRAKSLSWNKNNTPRMFNYASPSCGYRKFIKRSELEESSFLRNDRLKIVCDIMVILGTPVSRSEPVLCDIKVPPSDLSRNLGKLLQSEEGADVTFKVEGVEFHAHKIVLAMRSPVFKAELCGPMRETMDITVEDMQPAVFDALLHFIYKDALPAMDDLDREENGEMVKHLLVAADRYAMERMKMLCERMLYKKLDVENVAMTLALADKHHCSKLKDACIQFIISSNRMQDVVASPGYEHLKTACPAVFADLWEKSASLASV